MEKIKTAILVSGRGSNMQSLIIAAKKENFPAKITDVISNQKNAKAIEKAHKYQIKTHFIENNQNFENQLSDLLWQQKIQIICCAGFMRILSAPFLQKCWRKNIVIINIHPSLLPKFKGLNAVKKTFKAQDKIVGATVHYVNEKVDGGEIIIQKQIEIKENYQLETLEQKILEIEHQIYKIALEKICKDMIQQKVEMKN